MNLPHWQLKNIYPSLDSKQLKDSILELGNIQDRLEQNLAKNPKPSPQEFENMLDLLSQMYTKSSDIRSFLTGFIAVDAFNEEAARLRSSLNKLNSQRSIISKRFTALVANLDLQEIYKHSKLAKTHSFYLEKYQKLSNHLLAPEAEEIVAHLAPSSADAFVKLQGDLISKTSLKIKIADSEQEYNIAQLKQLQSHASPQVREQAYKAELTLLEQNQYSYAAAMNSIKGYVGKLAKEKNWDSVLDQALFANNISQKSLTALQEAGIDSLASFRNYYRAKAKILGKNKLQWFDILAPISNKESKTFSWQEAQDFIIENFGKYSTELADYAKRAFDNNWLDVPSRKGKRNGAFCMGIPGAKESRIMLNFVGSLDDLFTLAHELGHGYHNEQKYKAGLTILQQDTPMTLAETASIFCETIVVNAMLENATDLERLAILEQDLLGSGQLVVDIYSRFIFEKTVFNKRQERELSVTEFKEIMLNAQEETYADAIATKHPFAWAQKGHYYSTNRSYYNFPYTFGYLFGLGLYNEYQNKPEGFQARYNKLLASTGLADAKTLAKDFGIDIEDKEFWKSSLRIAQARAQEYIKLVDKYYS